MDRPSRNLVGICGVFVLLGLPGEQSAFAALPEQLPVVDNLAPKAELSGSGEDLGQQALVSALNALMVHLSGEASLAPSELAEYKTTIYANKDFFGASSAIIAASFKLVATYDTEVGPLWVPGSPQEKLMRADMSDSEIHWAVYTVMQNIIDKTYTGSNIVENEDLFSGFKFGSSAWFPGACDAPEDPEKTTTVTINASFLETFGRDTMFWTRPARKPTGTYLAPGTIATVIVPEALVGKGYQVRVGSHS